MDLDLAQAAAPDELARLLVEERPAAESACVPMLELALEALLGLVRRADAAKPLGNPPVLLEGNVELEMSERGTLRAQVGSLEALRCSRYGGDASLDS